MLRVSVSMPALCGFAVGLIAGANLAVIRRACQRLHDRAVEPRLCCSMCGRQQPLSAFNARQARRRDAVRKCTRCVSAYVVPPPAVVPAAVVPAPSGSAAPNAAESTQQQACDTPYDPLRLARKAETVLRGRTERILLVLENCS